MGRQPSISPKIDFSLTQHEIIQNFFRSISITPINETIKVCFGSSIPWFKKNFWNRLRFGDETIFQSQRRVIFSVKKWYTTDIFWNFNRFKLMSDFINTRFPMALSIDVKSFRFFLAMVRDLVEFNQPPRSRMHAISPNFRHRKMWLVSFKFLSRWI